MNLHPPKGTSLRVARGDAVREIILKLDDSTVAKLDDVSRRAFDLYKSNDFVRHTELLKFAGEVRLLAAPFAMISYRE
jgi:hypothetical protein